MLGESDVTLEISNTRLNYNKASYRGGGAICIYNNVQLVITNCSLNGNTAQQGGALWGRSKGGALYGHNDVTLEIRNTQLNNNKASTRGGAIYIYREVQLLITNCILDGNAADHDGGAIMIIEEIKEILKIYQSIFTRNALSYSNSESGTDVAIQESSSLEVR